MMDFIMNGEDDTAFTKLIFYQLHTMEINEFMIGISMFSCNKIAHTSW